MTVLSDVSILEILHDVVKPYREEYVNPASIDLTISGHYIDRLDNREYVEESITLQPRSVIKDYVYLIRKKICIMFGMIPPKHVPSSILATTIEYVNLPSDIAGDVKLKSSRAREGWDHALAGWIDPGFNGQITLELHCHRRVSISARSPFCQIVLHNVDRKVAFAYDGGYQHQSGPTRSYHEENI